MTGKSLGYEFDHITDDIWRTIKRFDFLWRRRFRGVKIRLKHCFLLKLEMKTFFGILTTFLTPSKKFENNENFSFNLNKSFSFLSNFDLKITQIVFVSLYD